MTTNLDEFLLHIGERVAGNDFKPIDNWIFGDKEVRMLETLRRRGLLYAWRQSDLMDGVEFSGVALTRKGILQWKRLRQKHGNP